MDKASWIEIDIRPEHRAILKEMLGDKFEIIFLELSALLPFVACLKNPQVRPLAKTKVELDQLQQSVMKTSQLLSNYDLKPFLRPSSKLSELLIQLSSMEELINKRLEFLADFEKDKNARATKRQRQRADNVQIEFLARGIAEIFNHNAEKITFTKQTDLAKDSNFISVVKIACKELNLEVPKDLRKLLAPKL